MSTQLIDLQSKSEKKTPLPSAGTTTRSMMYPSRDPITVADAAASGENTSTQQLLDVIKFLRREKEISDTKCDVRSL